MGGSGSDNFVKYLIYVHLHTIYYVKVPIIFGGRERISLPPTITIIR